MRAYPLVLLLGLLGCEASPIIDDPIVPPPPPPPPPPTCPAGLTCVSAFPFHDEDDTSLLSNATLDAYSCAVNTNESGAEKVYRVTVPIDGFLSAAVHDADGIDVDVHILSALDANSCLSRGDRDASADVTAGDFFVVVDTFVNSSGTELAGPFALDIGFIAPSIGPCDLEVGTMSRIGDGGNALIMPATGPIVLEAHLVTQDEPAPFPASFTDELDAHYALSQEETGLVMFRDQTWAPLEGGGFFGAGIGDPADFPVFDEGWYVNMMWASSARPDKGARMILRDPNGGSRAVVVAAGYETGPGNLSHIGGTPEETHFYMGTTHLDTMTLGIAIDQSLPLGPRVCE
jgi:hypothetical protein